MGDYWGVQRSTPEFYDPEGVSLVLLYTNRGVSLFNEIEVISTSVSYENVLDCNENVELDEKEPVLRSAFFSLYKKGGLKTIRQFCNKLENRNIMGYFKRILAKSIRYIIG